MQSENRISIFEKIVAITNSIQKIHAVEIREQLIVLVNELINKDFDALVQLLYRIDVYEKKVRLSLNQNTNEDAASIIADLIIERQLQKIESRKQFRENKTNETNESNEEKW